MGKQRALFDEEIGSLTEEMREEAKAAHHKSEGEKRKLETQVVALKEKLEANGIGSICWSTCSSLASLSPPSTPLCMRPESAATERSTASSVSSVRTIIHSLNKIVNHKGEVDAADLKEELKGEEEFDLSEDLESSLQLFNGLLHSKDDQITHLKLEANELHSELDLLRMKENNLRDMQALATDEAETICKLEKRNFELVELQKKLEVKMEVEKEKLKRGLDNVKKEGDLLKILVNELHREIDGKDDQIKEIATQLAEAKDDVLKLEEANSRLKGQVMFDVLGITEAIHEDAEALSDSDDSDTLTPLNDVTLDDLLLDDLDGSDTDTGDPA